MDKKSSRLRRAKRIRIQMRNLNKVRLCVHRTSQHIYAQVISGDGMNVIVSASTLEKEVNAECSSSSNIDASIIVGKFIAQRAVANGINAVAFDRSGFKYHGRVKALADSAREHGLKF